MMSRSSTMLILLASLFRSPGNWALEIGDNLCVQGYIMDKFCIDSVNMIDTGRETLKEPFEHSVHCLVDTPICYNSEFEVLTDPTTTSDADARYTRGYRLTETSKQLVIDLARSVGSCATCVKGYDSDVEFGFRAVLNATVLALSTDGGEGPPLIMAHNQAFPNPSDNDPCQTVFGLTEGTVMFNNPNVTSDDGTNEGTADSEATSMLSFASSQFVHGLLITILGLYMS
ncbi:unnamed protein product [Cylindrotheca closterium]|uniref:Uncharacterized protein n=1 Tax=Cylindrotheca closterium TaxID=2856 RepID=A0AAD2JKL9_9STRA|nr:unnamed protein product [Cylindrotheca closterium]